MECKVKSLTPKRYILCSNKEMKMTFKGNIEFSIKRGDWKATPRLQVIIYSLIVYL